MAAQWYVSKEGRKMGPYAPEELQEMVDRGRVRGGDLVWCDGMADWLPARSVMKPTGYEAGRRRHDEDEVDDDQDRDDRAYRRAAERTVPGGPGSDFPRRLVTPGFFFLSVLLFFLPWVDVNCNGFSVVSQSGVQTCLGDYSESMFLLEQRGRANQILTNQIKPAPLIIAYIPVILAGLVLGLALRCGMTRGVILALCSLAGLGLMLGQLIMGFPIKEQVARANADPAVIEELRRHAGNDPRNIGFPPVVGAAQVPVLRLSPTIWFWMAVFFTFGGLIGLALEQIGGGPEPSRQRRAVY